MEGNIKLKAQTNGMIAIHQRDSSFGPKKVIIKMSRLKDADKIQRAKKKRKGLDLSLIGINSAVFINDSLCWYYNNLWAKCKKLWLIKFIHRFWTYNESIRLKLTETSILHMMSIWKSFFQAMS